MSALLPQNRLAIFRPSDFLSGLGVGDIVVDGTRTFGGKLFQLEEHVTRLFKGAEELFLTSDLAISEVAETAKQAADDFFERSDAPCECEIKFALAASGSRPEERKSVLYLTARGINDQVRALDNKYRNGCELTVVNQYALPSTFSPPQIKSRGSAHWRRAELMAELNRKGSWALLLHEDGMISEGVGLGASGWNIHAVVNETILTPPTGRAVDGTAKRYFKARAQELGIAHHEIDLSVDQILKADEVFITSSFIGIMPVSSVSGSVINCSNVWGTITRKLAKSFQEDFDLKVGGAFD